MIKGWEVLWKVLGQVQTLIKYFLSGNKKKRKEKSAAFLQIIPLYFTCFRTSVESSSKQLEHSEGSGFTASQTRRASERCLSLQKINVNHKNGITENQASYLTDETATCLLLSQGVLCKQSTYCKVNRQKSHRTWPTSAENKSNQISALMSGNRMRQQATKIFADIKICTW